MVGSTAAAPPSPHRNCPVEILYREVDHPSPPLRAEEDVPPSLPLPTAGGVLSLSNSARPTSSTHPLLSSKNKVSSGEAAATTDQHTRPPKAPPKKRLRSPIVPLVGSPGVNLVLSQALPRSIGVKRPSPTPSQIPRLSRSTKRRKLKSEIWNDFDPMYVGNKLMEAKCKHCKRDFVATREAGTSQCLRHLLVCEERAKINEFLDSMKSAMSQSDPNSSEKWKYDPDRAYTELVRMIVLHELPFRIVEYEGFIRFVQSLNPTFELVSRTTVRLDCLDMFGQERIKLREVLQKLNSRVSFTADMWTSRQVVSYMCITCHFVDEKWKLQKKVIWFSEAETPHDGINLFNIMLECMQGWGLQKKVFSITLDNASNNNLCVSYMQANLLGKNLLPCKGDLLHGRCGAHVINLIVQDGLVITCMAVEKIRNSIKYVRSSPTRKKKFKDMVAQEGISCKSSLSLDVVTRWNSTHLMIKTALEYRRAFAALKLQDTSYTCQPTHDEWETAESVCNLLEVFLNATMVVSGTLYPTAHLYFHELWKINLTLEREAKREDVIKSMVEAMQKKFMKYWKLSYLTICLPVILDPRYKFKFLELCLKSGMESEATKYLSKVKKTFKDMFAAYSSHDDDSTMENDQGTNNVAAGIDNPWDQWNKQVLEEQQNRAKLSELHVYLKDDVHVHPQEDDFDILYWWSTNSHKYPIISRIAKDVLAAPVSTVASESAFSTGGRILSDYRSHMVCSTVEALICLQDWIRPHGTARVNTIISDVVYATRAAIYGTDGDILGS